VISHDHFIRGVYETVQGFPNKRFGFDSSLFQINTPFARSLCITKSSSFTEINCSTLPPRKRRKKRRKGTDTAPLKDVSKKEIYFDCVSFAEPALSKAAAQYLQQMDLYFFYTFMCQVQHNEVKVKVNFVEVGVSGKWWIYCNEDLSCKPVLFTDIRLFVGCICETECCSID
jgi:hypothetical protein